MRRIAAAGQAVTARASSQLLGDCSLPALRQRTSLKWRTYPDDVLSAFVAEMDYALAGPIKDTVTAAISAGDAGYAHIGRLGEVFAAFAADRFTGRRVVEAPLRTAGRPAWHPRVRRRVEQSLPWLDPGAGAAGPQPCPAVAAAD
jgi:hypothetical protein